MTAMTEPQAHYRQDLIDRKVDGLKSHSEPMTVVLAFLAANLPEPTDSRDASAQIDALKRDIRKYKPEHAQALLNTLGNAGIKSLVATVKTLRHLDHAADLTADYGVREGKAILHAETLAALTI